MAHDRPTCTGCGKTHYKSRLADLCARGELKRAAAPFAKATAPAPKPRPRRGDPAEAVGGTD